MNAIKEDIRQLVKVSTYARNYGITPTWVYKLAEQGKLNIIEIDGVKFVKTVI